MPFTEKDLKRVKNNLIKNSLTFSLTPQEIVVEDAEKIMEDLFKEFPIDDFYTHYTEPPCDHSLEIRIWLENRKVEAAIVKWYDEEDDGEEEINGLGIYISKEKKLLCANYVKDIEEVIKLIKPITEACLE